MNWLVLGAGLFGLVAVIGHFTAGSKNFLKPMLDASFDEISKKVMLSVFHYVSVFLILSSIVLLCIGFGYSFELDSQFVLWFISINYLFFAVAQVVIALTSKIQSSLIKLFQWVFWVIIGGLSFVGALVGI